MGMWRLRVPTLTSLTQCSNSGLASVPPAINWANEAPCTRCKWLLNSISIDIHLGLALLTLSCDKNWDSQLLVNGYPSFYPRIALVAPIPGLSNLRLQLSTMLTGGTCKNTLVLLENLSDLYLLTHWPQLQPQQLLHNSLKQRFICGRECHESRGVIVPNDDNHGYLLMELKLTTNITIFDVTGGPFFVCIHCVAPRPVSRFCARSSTKGTGLFNCTFKIRISVVVTVGGLRVPSLTWGPISGLVCLSIVVGTYIVASWNEDS